MPKTGIFSKTLCWDCIHAVPDGVHGCSWSKKFKPVKDWVAVKDKFHENAGLTVLSCPQFKRDSFNYGLSHVEK